MKTILRSITVAGYFFAVAIPAYAQSNNSFIFKLDQSMQTSAGIFAKDGTLLRALWNGVTYNSGSHTAYWDGIDDEGKPVPDGDYIIKVLSNKVDYTWEGVIGNTSGKMSGPTVHRALLKMYGMAINGKHAYYATGYNEQSSSTFEFNTDTPQVKKTVLGKGMAAQFVTTDGINVYWAGMDPNVISNWFVYATGTQNDLETSFQFGKPEGTKYGRKYSSAINIVSNTKAAISGLAVQKKGNLLFIAHKGLNQINVLDKSTGSLLKTFSIESPESLTMDNDDNLWLLCLSDGKQVAEKFKAAADGSLQFLNLRINNLVDPLSLAVSPVENILVIADGGSSQQLKAFDNKSANPVWTFGVLGGYQNDPAVENDKFYFGDKRGDQGTFITFEPDGSFWVEDAGNSRAQHYSASRKFINRIMYLQISYSSSVDANDPERVFSDYLEFKMDYSKPLAPDNGSWTLVRNWGCNVTGEYDDKYARLKNVNTLSNGKTYALLPRFNKAKPTWQLVELPARGSLRFTGVEIPNDNSQLYPDGSIRKLSPFIPGSPTVFTERKLLKFDDSYNPVWGPEIVLAGTPPSGPADPAYRGNNTTLKSGEMTSSGVMVLFDGSLNKGWHLGGVRSGENKWLWRTAQSTFKEYSGLFPSDGSYDTGNGVVNAGSTVMVLDKSIIWGYHGEGWKSGQVNKWNHIFDDGLFIGQFGIAGIDAPGYDASPQMAGNSFAASLVKVNGDYYLFHNDESFHSGIHRWKISGMETIKEEIIPLKKKSFTNVLISNGDSGLSENLPFNSVLENNKFGWTRDPAMDDYTDKYKKWWTVRTNVKSLSHAAPDVYANFQEQNGNATLTREFGNNSELNNWTFSGNINYAANSVNVSSGPEIKGNGGVYFELLDKDKKVIVRIFLHAADYRGDVQLYANNQMLYQMPRTLLNHLEDRMEPITVKLLNGQLQINYGSGKPYLTERFDQTANVRIPDYISLSFYSNGSSSGYKVDLKNLSFSPK